MYRTAVCDEQIFAVRRIFLKFSDKKWNIPMSPYCHWNDIAKLLLMIFQCPHFVSEAILQNSHTQVSNVPILSLKQHSKLSLMIFWCPHFVAETTLQNSCWWYSYVPILSLNQIAKQALPIFKCPHFEIQRQKVDFFNKKYQRHFWGCDEKKFQRQMCDCQNSLRTYVIRYLIWVSISIGNPLIFSSEK